MKTFEFKRILFCTMLLMLFINASSEVKIGDARCEGKINPTGISTNDIRLSWEILSNEKNVMQSAYQLVIASSLKNLNDERYDIYNSLVVKSDRSLGVQLKGKKIESAKSYYWKVKIWDTKKKGTLWSQPQKFITGIFTKSEWKNAKWIGYEELPDSLHLVPGVHGLDKALINKYGDKFKKTSVLPLLRKSFLLNKDIQSATLFITGLGQYELSINGAKTGFAFLSPGWTNYNKAVLYNTYNVTSQLKPGENAIGVMLGNGFYNISRERYFKLLTAYGNPKMICRLKIDYTDGSEENIVSDKSWKTTQSPITFSNVYGGESYDARLEQKDWNKGGFKDLAWKNAEIVKSPLGKLTPETDYPVALVDSFNVQKIEEPVPGIYMYDFGQNISGVFTLKIKGKAGQTIKITPAELLTQRGLSNQSATGEPHFYTYTLKGDGVEVWQPRFTYYGFRYLQIEGAVPEKEANTLNVPTIINLTSWHNQNTNPASGAFVCSNPLFNKIFNLINWAIKSNMQSVVTDCPHREKLGWLEQDYLMGNSIRYNFDIYNLYCKLINDMIDSQHKDGLVPDITPEYVSFEGGFLSSPEWGSASVILPWMLYKWYGDTNNINKAYPMMKKYVNYLKSKSDNSILSFGLGDWFDYGPKTPGEAQLTPKSLTATSIYYYDVMLLSKMATIIGKKEDANLYQTLANEIKTSFNNKFFNTATKIYSTGSQTAMAMPLCLGLVNESDRKQVLGNLVDSITTHHNALTAGDIGFHFLVQALEEGGASQTLFDMINRDDVPGYGFQLKKGATTLTESWAALENVSNNHLMLGHVMEWLYSSIAGISQEDNSVGYKHIKICPQPVGDIDFAKGNFHSPSGWIILQWEKKALIFNLRVQIPANTKATVYLPITNNSKISMNGNNLDKFKKLDNVGIVDIGSGTYTFQVKQ